MQNTFYIVGSGPGDPELLTLKAYNVLSKASVVLFDNLVNEDLLDMLPTHCIKRYVGKKPFGEYVPQSDINALIAYYCPRYPTVVRLKGGDPYIYGRGFEEWAVAKQLGVHVVYVPGITSMQGVGMWDIPLTHRGTSEGVWVLTGMKRDGNISSDLSLAVQSHSTVVIYMGMRKLSEIARTYVMHGKGDTPAAILQDATKPESRRVTCAVRDLVKCSRAANMSNPAIIIIGEVVALNEAAASLSLKRNVV
ncbi:uroporphyrinogen-III C-methyltransferase [Parapedobacter sp. 10938]|uniref:uroporphyrinogen-III C-methyltransferase n=1 Tax=Parapedobacter flavus TaxID=3110225 RepID=UPI002DBCDC39|nr:uroporphyrinogen-III C-methyltransferase [Parapedobacter sp. 10938]MEC3878214.1 uroporphyrinogen-III C-methyltransferase [Parapedobacter sp. 10938]